MSFSVKNRKERTYSNAEMQSKSSLCSLIVKHPIDTGEFGVQLPTQVLDIVMKWLDMHRC